MIIANLVGAALRSSLVKAFRATFPQFEGDSVPTGGQGAPFATMIERFGEDYLRKFSAKQVKLCQNNPEAIAALMSMTNKTVVPLTASQRVRVANSRDGKAMGIDEASGEVVQVAVNTRILVFIQDGETLDQAFLRRMPHVAMVAQAEANEANTRVFAVANRYCLIRDCRTIKEALKFKFSDLAFRPSTTTMAVVITDTIPKSGFKGQIAIAGTYLAQPEFAAVRKNHRKPAKVAKVKKEKVAKVAKEKAPAKVAAAAAPAKVKRTRIERA